MKVKFVPQNVEFEIMPGQSVMHVAQDHNIYVKSVCKGVPSCAECRVRVIDGEHNVLPPGSEELSLIGTGHFIDRRRLSCQLKCYGDITIDMTEQIAKQQGLVGGQKKRKLAVKDDRIEDARAIRSEASEDESMQDEEVRSEERISESSPRPTSGPQRRGPRPASSKQNRETKPVIGAGIDRKTPSAESADKVFDVENDDVHDESDGDHEGDGESESGSAPAGPSTSGPRPVTGSQRPQRPGGGPDGGENPRGRRRRRRGGRGGGGPSGQGSGGGPSGQGGGGGGPSGQGGSSSHRGGGQGGGAGQGPRGK